MNARGHVLGTGLALCLAFAPESSFSAGAPGYASEVPPSQVIIAGSASGPATDGSIGSIPVAEELDYVQENSFHQPYDERLKVISKIDVFGTRYVGCGQHRLEVHTGRPGQMRASLVDSDGKTFEVVRSDSGISFHGEPQGLALEQERALAQVFSFDTPAIRLQRDAKAFRPLGMQKLAGVLAWKIEAGSAQGFRETLYVDSHFGDVVRFTITDQKNATIVDVKEHDYRNVGDIRIPFAIDYLDSNGTLLVSDRFERAEVTPVGS